MWLDITKNLKLTPENNNNSITHLKHHCWTLCALLSLPILLQLGFIYFFLFGKNQVVTLHDITHRFVRTV